jgi:hypothetical protein
LFSCTSGVLPIVRSMDGRIEGFEMGIMAFLDELPFFDGQEKPIFVWFYDSYHNCLPIETKSFRGDA